MHVLILSFYLPPDDDNRIILRPIEGHSDCQRDFINACYVDVCCSPLRVYVLRIYLVCVFYSAYNLQGYKCRNKFIAAQGKIRSTLHYMMFIILTSAAGPMPKTLVDFWRLMWQEKPPTIVMVTNLVEGTKTKCQQYWPDAGAQSFGPFQVTITDQQILADYTTRSLLVQVSVSQCTCSQF